MSENEATNFLKQFFFFFIDPCKESAAATTKRSKFCLVGQMYKHTFVLYNETTVIYKTTRTQTHRHVTQKRDRRRKTTLKRCTHGFIKMYLRTPVIRDEFQGHYERTIISHQTGLRENEMHCRGLKKEPHFNQKPARVSSLIFCYCPPAVETESVKGSDGMQDFYQFVTSHQKQYHKRPELFRSVFAGQLACIAGHYRMLQVECCVVEQVNVFSSV